MPAYAGDVNTLQLSFYLKQSQHTYELTVGVMEDLDDPETFEPVVSFDHNSISSAAKMADTSATPLMPLPLSSPMFSFVMPPIPTIGISTASDSSLRTFRSIFLASPLVDVPKHAPTPR